MPKKNKINKKRKISKKKVITLIIILLIILFLIKIINTNITNIYVSGNNYLTDQEIIDISKLDDYPNTINNLTFKIKKRLKNNKFILDAKVKKNILFNEVYIEIEENYPLFYYSDTNKTVLYNSDEIDDIKSLVTVINHVPDTIYKTLVEKFRKIDLNTLNRISELEYSPNERYNDRFLILMTDGNYIYITLDKFSTLNRYLDIIKHMDSNEKGIIRLDSGEYFEKFN